MDISYSFFLFVVVAAFTPGPNNIMMMASGLNYGVKASLPHLLGIAFGVPTMLVAVGSGLAYLFEKWGWLHSVVQLLGVVYLVYLAWLIANSTSAPLENEVRHNKPFTFLQAALFQWVNPKAWMTGTGAIATFSNADADMFGQIVFMALAFCLAVFPSAGSWLVFGAWLKRLFRDAKHLVLFNRAMALILVVSVLPVLKNMLEEFSYL